MESTCRLLITTMAAAALAAVAYAAEADSLRFEVTGAGPDPLTVKSNGTAYTILAPLPFGRFTIRAYLKYDTGTAGRVKSWLVSPFFAKTATSALWLDDYGQSKSYPVGSRPKSLDNDMTFNILAGSIEDYVVGLCREHASELSASGQSQAQIYGRDRELSFSVGIGATVVATGAGSNDPDVTQFPPKPIRVVCQAAGGPQVPLGSTDLAPAVRVEDARLRVEPQPTHSGQCKAKLTAIVRLDRANYPVKVQFVHSSGSESGILTGRTAANNIALVTRTVDIPQVEGPEIGNFSLVVHEPTRETFGLVMYSMNCADIGHLRPQPAPPPTASDTLNSEGRPPAAPSVREDRVAPPSSTPLFVPRREPRSPAPIFSVPERTN